MQSMVRTRVTVAVLIFVLFNMLVATVVHASTAMRGQLNFQLKTVGAPVVVSQLKVGSAYQAFETQLMNEISDGKRALELIRKFDEITPATWEHIAERTKSLVVRKDGDEFWDMLDRNQWVGPIFHYVEGGEEDEAPYVVVNTDLRTGTEDTPETIKWVSDMRQSMSRLPKFQGISFRGTRLDKARVERYFPTNGKSIDAAFVSSSVNVGTAENFARLNDPQYANAKDKAKINLMIVIKGHTGRAVSTFARMHQHEQEILFANSTPFKVIAKSSVVDDSSLGGPTQVIILEEETMNQEKHQ